MLFKSQLKSGFSKIHNLFGDLLDELIALKMCHLAQRGISNELELKRSETKFYDINRKKEFQKD